MTRIYKRKTDRRNGVSHKPQSIGESYTPGFLTKLDQRTELCRMLRERFDSIASDLGGVDQLSRIKSSLLERFLWLEAVLGKIETTLGLLEDPKTASALLGTWIQACNSLMGIAKVLGVERQAHMMDVKTYVAAYTTAEDLADK